MIFCPYGSTCCTTLLPSVADVGAACPHVQKTVTDSASCCTLHSGGVTGGALSCPHVVARCIDVALRVSNAVTRCLSIARCCTDFTSGHYACRNGVLACRNALPSRRGYGSRCGESRFRCFDLVFTMSGDMGQGEIGKQRGTSEFLCCLFGCISRCATQRHDDPIEEIHLFGGQSRARRFSLLGSGT